MTYRVVSRAPFLSSYTFIFYPLRRSASLSFHLFAFLSLILLEFNSPSLQTSIQ
jgi:hypothetical protein